MTSSEIIEAFKADSKKIQQKKAIIDIDKEKKARKKEECFRQHKISMTLRTRIRLALKISTAKGKLAKKSAKTISLLGCAISEFMTHMENLFENGMSWGNYGNKHNNWNIDHIIPISLFDISCSEEQEIAFHYTNCQPMWSSENHSKSNRYIGKATPPDIQKIGKLYSYPSAATREKILNKPEEKKSYLWLRNPMEFAEVIIALRIENKNEKRTYKKREYNDKLKLKLFNEKLKIGILRSHPNMFASEVKSFFDSLC